MTTTVRGGLSGLDLNVDEALAAQVFEYIPGYPVAGGFYSVSGYTTAVVAAALAANTTLMSARLSTGSARKAYIHRLRVHMAPATAGAAGGIPSVLGLQRFTTATPSGGTARVVDRAGPTKGTASDMTDVRDSNAALTVTGVVFGNLICSGTVPISSTNVGPFEWIAEFKAPIELSAGDGICLRTQNVGPATATWVYSYNLYWGER